MASYVVLAQWQETAHALEAVLRSLCWQASSRGVGPVTIVPGMPIDRVSTVATCDAVAARIEAAGRAGGEEESPEDLVVLVDAINPWGLSAVAEGGWEAMIAMLILAFPEARWVFGVGKVRIELEETKGDALAKRWNAVAACHSLSSLLDPVCSVPLFDPTGLREWVRERTNSMLAKMGDDLQLPLRRERAAAIDEERPYAYLHAATAYRFGCRVEMVTTWTSMKKCFWQEPHGDLEPHGYWLLLEDMSLNFHDREPRTSLLDLEERSEKLGKLDSTRNPPENSTHRVLVTTGQSRRHDDVLARNKNYLARKLGGGGRVVLKPSSGMFELWRQSGLMRGGRRGSRAGNAPGFVWPAGKPGDVKLDARAHGAPGKLLHVAELLIARSEKLLRQTSSVSQAVRGAVLATDAIEYTGGRTPTTAIAALSLKHRFEVLAECEFSGVEYHLSIVPRLQEIRIETAAISHWFHHRRQADAMLNAEMSILSGLVGVLRQNSQFDEEQVCISRIRRLHNTLWMRQGPFRILLLPLLRYLELLLSSFAVFVAILVLWIIALSILFNAMNDYSGFGAPISDALSSFFSVGQALSHPDTAATNKDIKWGHVVVSCLAIVSGFIHLGVFVSHLYTITSRR